MDSDRNFRTLLRRWRHRPIPYVLAILAALAALGAVTVTTSSGAPAAVAPAAAVSAPLDPLSADEIATVFDVVQSSSKYPAGGFFPTVNLKEPTKGELASWSPGKPFSRQAFVNIYDRTANKLYEAVVDLRTQKLVSWAQRPGLQPPVFATEYADVEALVRADPRWKKAIRDRGIDPDDVYLDAGWAVGDVTVPGVPAATRLLRALSFYQGNLPNPYDRPIEGVIVTIDMNRLKVVEVIDSPIRPVNKTITGNAETTRPALKPLRVNQPDGPSFTQNGNEVRWQGWRFRVGYSQREGLVLYEIGYEQDGSVRPIIHRIALDEVYVPYAIPDRTGRGARRSMSASTTSASSRRP